MNARHSVLLLTCWLALAPMASSGLPLDIPPHVVTLHFSAPNGDSARQGEPFHYRLAMTNGLPIAVNGSVDVTLVPPSGSPANRLETWTGIVTAGATVTLDYVTTSTVYSDQVGAFKITASGVFRLQQLPAVIIDSPSATLPFDVKDPAVPAVVFEDVAAQMGITTKFGKVGCQDYAQGMAWGDVDGDGKLDLFVPQRSGPSELWINEGASFVNRAGDYGVENRNPDGSYSVGIGAVFVDYDNNGTLDLFVTNDGVNRLYRNNDDGTFTDVTGAAGLTADGNFTSAGWGDYDGDGYLDFYVASHGRRAACDQLFTPVGHHLYHNEGDGTFTDVTNLLPHTEPDLGLGFQPSWLDYNNDGRPDLHLANDLVWIGEDQPDFLWRNDGPGPGGQWKFTNVSAASGAGIEANAMGTAIGDYDRDGNLDIALSNIGPMVLLRNNGDGTFTDKAKQAGVARTKTKEGVKSITWGLTLNDFNNDGWEDLYVAGGSLLLGDIPEPQPNEMFVNLGNGRFLDLSAPSHADDPGISRGVAVADYDGDGRLDVVVADLDGPLHLYHNATPTTNHWLEISVKNSTNRDACGARLTGVWPAAASKPMIREVFCGSTGEASGSDPTVHFGLGSHTTIPKLEITWSSGAQQVLNDVAADQRITLTEP